jgi:hypothetical protein
MFTDPKGPIEKFEWGCFQINGEVHSAEGKGVGKDIFMVGEAVQPWAARQGHRLKPSMVACVIDIRIDTLVIGKGVNGALKVPKKTQKHIRAAGIKTLIIEKTPEACRTYNDLVRRGEKAALLAHGTC